MSIGTRDRWCVDGGEDDRVPADDRAIAYGDGLFETIAVVDGAPRLLAHHLDRLLDGAGRLGIPADRDAIASILRREAATLGRGVLKLVLSRGSGPRGYAPPPEPAPRIILGIAPRGEAFAQIDGRPLCARTCDTPAGISPALAGLKHLNRLEQVLARSEWQDPAVHEGLMYDSDGFLVCATAANVFLVTAGDRLVTPDLSRSGVAGVMRRAVLEVAAGLGIAAEVRAVRREELSQARELMLSSSILGLRSVGVLDGRQVPVGAVAERLRAALRDYLKGAAGT